MENWQQKWAEIVARSWIDEHFRNELIHHPEKTLKREGIDCHNKRCKILENTPDCFYLVIPQKPRGSLNEQELKRAAGGRGTPPWDQDLRSNLH